MIITLFACAPLEQPKIEKKSTAIKILAGVLKPNFGEEQEVGYDELIAHFKGTELQAFFEKSKKGDIKVAYKPQQVDLIPKQIKGKVKTLLKKVDDSDRFDEIIDSLELKKVLITQRKMPYLNL